MKPLLCNEGGLGLGIWRLWNKEAERAEVEEADGFGIYKGSSLSSKQFAYSQLQWTCAIVFRKGIGGLSETQKKREIKKLKK